MAITRHFHCPVCGKRLFIHRGSEPYDTHSGRTIAFCENCKEWFNDFELVIFYENRRD